MRKHHVFLCSVLSVASVASAQQPATSGTPASVQSGTALAPASATPVASVASITRTATGAPAGPSVSSSAGDSVAVPASIPTPTPAPTPVAIEMPVPIEPPTSAVPAAATAPASSPALPASTVTPAEPAPIPPPVQTAALEPTAPAAVVPTTPAPAVPGTVLPPVTPPSPALPGVVGPPATVAGVIPASVASAATVAIAPGGRSVQDFQGDDIGQVLRLLARQAGINLVVSDQVAGTITMRLENKSPLEAIGVIATAKGLNMDEVNGVYFIKTAAEKQREPTESANYTFSYATAATVAPLLASQIQSGVAPMFDVRTNTVYYREFKSNLANIKLFLETVDRPTQQVMIEARLVEVNANPKQSYGINWGGVVGSSVSPQKISYGGSGIGATGLVAAQHVNPFTGTTTPYLGANGVPIQVPTQTSLPTVPSDGSLQNFIFGGNLSNFGKTIGGQLAILNAPQLSVTLRMLNEDADSQFLANPRIVTANNLKASIKITRNQPVPQLNFNEQTAQAVFGGFSDKEFGNMLQVTPTINKDDFITMLVQPEISNKVADATFIFSGASVSSPIIDKRTLESTVLIKSGDTLAIGGLLQDETTKQSTKVPVLGDIPIIGYAFQEHLNERTKRNLLIFVTPTIIRQGYGTGLEDQVSGLKNSGEEYADPNGWRNNAKGAVRLVPTSNRQSGADYPKPGVPPAPDGGSLYKVSAPSREQ